MTLEAIYQELTSEGFKFRFEGEGITIKGNPRVLEPLKPTLKAYKEEFTRPWSSGKHPTCGRLNACKLSSKPATDTPASTRF